MTDKFPSTVSVIVPLHNKALYIGATIDSVLAQTISGWELWVVDNGSTDGGDLIAEKYVNKDARIHLIHYPVCTGGPGAPRNFGLKQASGEWVLFLDADDLLLPNYLEQQLTVARLNPQSDIVVGAWQEFTDDNPADLLLKYPSGLEQTTEALQDSAIAFAPWAVHAALVRRSVLSSDWLWPEEMDPYLGEDITFWFRLISQCKVAYSHSSGALYRTQTDQCRTQNRDPEKWFSGVNAAIEWNQAYWRLNKGEFTSGQCESLMRAYAELYLLARRYQSTVVQRESLRLSQRWLDYYFKLVKQPGFNMLVRRFLGIRTSTMISLFYSYLKSGFT